MWTGQSFDKTMESVSEPGTEGNENEAECLEGKMARRRDRDRRLVQPAELVQRRSHGTHGLRLALLRHATWTHRLHDCDPYAPGNRHDGYGADRARAHQRAVDHRQVPR